MVEFICSFSYFYFFRICVYIYVEYINKTKLVFMFLLYTVTLLYFNLKQSLNKVNTNANLLTTWLFSGVTVWPRVLFLVINDLRFHICLISYQDFISYLSWTRQWNCCVKGKCSVHTQVCIRS